MMTAKDTQTLPSVLSKNHPESECRLIFVDGIFRPDLSEALPGGVEILAPDALAQLPKPFAEFLQPAFVDVNAAQSMARFVLRVRRQTLVAKPLHFIHRHSEGRQPLSSLFVPRTLLVEAGAKVGFLESMTDGVNADLLNLATDILVEANAAVTQDVWQAAQTTAATIHTTRVQVLRAAQYAQNYFTTGGKSLRHNVQVHLSEPGASCELQALSALLPGTEAHHHTLVEHLAPETQTSQTYKAIVADHAKAYFSGLVHVHPAAQKTAAAQLSKNLLIGKTAEANAKPELRIEADDVKCTHGATVGRLDPEALFYLQSRGLPQSSAVPLLIRAFAEDVLEKFHLASWKNQFAEILVKNFLSEGAA